VETEIKKAKFVLKTIHYIVAGFLVLTFSLAGAVYELGHKQAEVGNMIKVVCGGYGYYSDENKATICCLPDKLRIVKSPTETEEHNKDGSIAYNAAFDKLCRK